MDLRRDPIQGLALAGKWAACLLATALAAFGAASRPNIVLILADDLGYGDIGAYGGKDVPTPNIDRLAREGVKFTDAYVTSPACAPSRLSLMAGAYPQRFGMTWNDDRSAHRLPDSQRLLPELLRTAGYRTGLIGKWNIIRPAEKVFDEVHDFIEWESDFWSQPDGRYIGSNATTNPGFRSSKTQFWGPVREGDEYLTDRLGRRAVDFIDRHAAKPFFLYVGFNAVHSPWQGRKSDQARFAHLPHEVLQLYASMIAGMDDAVGRILAALRERGLEENTLVLFLRLSSVRRVRCGARRPTFSRAASASRSSRAGRPDSRRARSFVIRSSPTMCCPRFVPWRGRRYRRVRWSMVSICCPMSAARRPASRTKRSFGRSNPRPPCAGATGSS
jgi:hypothetical protein